MGESRWRAALSLLIHVARRYQRDRASSMAASLSYTSLLSLVPLLAVALAVLAIFPIFGDTRAMVETWVFANFVPAVGRTVREAVTTFIANAGQLSAAGLVGLAVSAVTLLFTIETEMGFVFRVTERRGLAARLLVYGTLLTLGPLLIGASLSLEGALLADITWQGANATLAVLAVPLPTLLSIGAFSLLFALAPNRRVAALDALAGGTVAGLLFALLRWGFAVYITHSDSYATLYGAVAVVPILLLWGFLSWAVVLVGAEFTASLPEWRAGRNDGEDGGGSATGPL